MLVDPVEVEGLSVDEELRAGDVNGADANRQGVDVLLRHAAGLSLHLHLGFQRKAVREVLGRQSPPGCLWVLHSAHSRKKAHCVAMCVKEELNLLPRGSTLHHAASPPSCCFK